MYKVAYLPNFREDSDLALALQSIVNHGEIIAINFITDQNEGDNQFARLRF